MQTAQKGRPGLKPGQRHSGQFRKGHDPRRMTPQTYKDGMTFRQLCLSHCEESLNVVVGIRDDPEEDTKVRLAAAIHILDRGLGKPLNGIALLTTDQNKDVKNLSNQELDQLILEHLSAQDAAAGAVESDDALEAEYAEVPSE